MREKSSHNCKLIPLSTKIQLVCLCLFNYADTVTDMVTMVGMFLDGSIVLGSVSLLVMLLVGWIVLQQTRTLPPYDSTDPARYQRRWSGSKILAFCTFSSTQHFVYENFLRQHPAGKYDRRTCQFYHKRNCKTSACNNARHKMLQLQIAISAEKMCENQAQFILQIIYLTPDYLSNSPKTEILGFWHYWQLVSLIFTILSLARTCFVWDSMKHDLVNYLFGFRAFGKGWKAFHPQKWFLYVVHTIIIANKVFTVVFLILLVNLDSPDDSKSGSCSLKTVLNVIALQSEYSCHFQSQFIWLLFLYVFVYTIGCLGLLRFLWLLFIYWDYVKSSLSKMMSWCLRIKSVIRSLAWLVFESFVRFPLDDVPLQMLFTTNITKNLPYAKRITFLMKFALSLLQAAATMILSIVIYQRDENFNDVQFGITPFHMAAIGIGIEVFHILLLLILVFWVDPEHVKSLSDEKILETLIRMGKVDDAIDLSCSWSADEIIREVIRKDERFNVYKEGVEENIINLKAKSCHEQNVVISTALERPTFDIALLQRRKPSHFKDGEIHANTSQVYRTQV